LCHSRAHLDEQNGSPRLIAASGRSLPHGQRPSGRLGGSVLIGAGGVTTARGCPPRLDHHLTRESAASQRGSAAAETPTGLLSAAHAFRVTPYGVLQPDTPIAAPRSCAEPSGSGEGRGRFWHRNVERPTSAVRPVVSWWNRDTLLLWRWDPTELGLDGTRIIKTIRATAAESWSCPGGAARGVGARDPLPG
jgi:hypothetical protein